MGVTIFWHQYNLHMHERRTLPLPGIICGGLRGLHYVVPVTLHQVWPTGIGACEKIYV